MATIGLILVLVGAFMLHWAFGLFVLGWLILMTEW